MESVNPKRLTNNYNLTSLHQNRVRPLANSQALFIVVRELFQQMDIPNDLFRIVTLLIHSFEYQVAMRGGEYHCLFLTNDGDIYGWGKNNLGQLGNGTRKDVEYSLTTTKIFDKLDGVSSIACGLYSSYAILKNGYVYVWGMRDYPCRKAITEPQRLKEFYRIAMISNGRNNCLAVNFEGEVFQWEDIDYGHNNYYTVVKKSTKIGYDSKKIDFNHSNSQTNTTIRIASVSCGLSHSMAISREGKLYSWGKNNKFGQLGNGNNETSNFPSLVVGSCRYSPISSLENVLSVTCGMNHTIILTKDGKLFSWGCDQYGQLGINLKFFTASDLPLRYWNTPQQINFPSSIQISMISAGDNHSLLLTKDGRVYSWGHNNYGQLGLGKNYFMEDNINNINNNIIRKNNDCTYYYELIRRITDIISPLCVYSPQRIKGFKNIVLVGCGTNFSYAISRDGIIYTWGRTLIEDETGLNVYAKFTYPLQVM